MNAQFDKYESLSKELSALPYVNEAQVRKWVGLQKLVDESDESLISGTVPMGIKKVVDKFNGRIEEAKKILKQHTYTLVFFGGTGVGKSTLINALN